MGYQHGKVVFTGWARGDIIENMLKDNRSADYNDSKFTDVSPAHAELNMPGVPLRRVTTISCLSVLRRLHRPGGDRVQDRAGPRLRHRR